MMRRPASFLLPLLLPNSRRPSPYQIPPKAPASLKVGVFSPCGPENRPRHKIPLTRCTSPYNFFLFPTLYIDCICNKPVTHALIHLIYNEIVCGGANPSSAACGAVIRQNAQRRLGRRKRRLTAHRLGGPPRRLYLLRGRQVCSGLRPLATLSRLRRPTGGVG